MTSETNKPIITAQKSERRPNLWYSRERVTTPAGRLAFSALREPDNTRFDGPEEPPKFRASIRWDNFDAEVEAVQPIYKTFMEQCREFVKQANPDLDLKKVNFPVKKHEGEDKEGKPRVYWHIDAKIGKDRRPELWDLVKSEKVEKEDMSRLYDGCVAAVEGCLMLCNAGGKWYVRIQLQRALHVKDGERYEGAPRESASPADFGIQASEAAPAAAAAGGDW